jgi:hypothetical protein
MSSPSLVPVKLPQLSGRLFSQHSVFFSSLHVNKILPVSGLRSPLMQVGSRWQCPMPSVPAARTQSHHPACRALRREPALRSQAKPIHHSNAIQTRHCERREESLLAFDFFRTLSTHARRIRRKTSTPGAAESSLRWRSSLAFSKIRRVDVRNFPFATLTLHHQRPPVQNVSVFDVERHHCYVLRQFLHAQIGRLQIHVRRNDPMGVFLDPLKDSEPSLLRFSGCINAPDIRRGRMKNRRFLAETCPERRLIQVVESRDKRALRSFDRRR